MKTESESGSVQSFPPHIPQLLNYLFQTHKDLSSPDPPRAPPKVRLSSLRISRMPASCGVSGTFWDSFLVHLANPRLCQLLWVCRCLLKGPRCRENTHNAGMKVIGASFWFDKDSHSCRKGLANLTRLQHGFGITTKHSREHTNDVCSILQCHCKASIQLETVRRRPLGLCFCLLQR